MINGKRVLALIPARGGSKAIPKKNIIDFCGKPLIAWSIETLKLTTEVDRIVVSTDCDEIASVAIAYGADVLMRPAHLATDQAVVLDTMKHVIHTLLEQGDVFDYITLIESTSPLRSVEDVKQCIQLIDEKGLDAVATFMEAQLNPHRAWKLVDGKPVPFIDGAIPWLPRQELPESYQLNGAVYINTIQSIMSSTKSLLNGEVGMVSMPKERSADINDYFDLKVAENIYREILS